MCHPPYSSYVQYCGGAISYYNKTLGHSIHTEDVRFEPLIISKGGLHGRILLFQQKEFLTIYYLQLEPTSDHIFQDMS